MNPMIAVIISVAVLATSSALPIGAGLGSGIGFNSDERGNYKTSVTIGGQLVDVGLSWAKDGTISAGAMLNNNEVPVYAALSTNVNNIRNDMKVEAGVRPIDTVSVALGTDMSYNVKYFANGLIPSSQYDGAIELGLEGENLKPSAVFAGITEKGKSIGARVGIDSDYKPENVNVVLGV